MSQYKIEVFRYTESGAVGERYTVKYANDPEQARFLCDQYAAQKQENGMKAFKVELYFLCYKKCEDNESFFRQFEV